MKIVARRLFSLMLALSLLVGLTACKKKEEPAPAPTEPATTTTTTTTKAKSNKKINPLTGAEDMTSKKNRPVAFAVPDESADITQIGIEHADMYFEAETEAGIPRLLAIFSSVDRLPESIGPVRSARPHFVNFVDALDAIYCHIGGSGDARQAIRDLDIDDIESAYETDSILLNSDNVSWNRKAFLKEKVLDAVTKYDYKTTTATKSPFKFGKKAGLAPATALDIKISHSYNIGFTYNEKSRLYTKHRVTQRGDGLAMDEHTTGSGGKVTVSNVIVMFDNRQVLDYKNGSAYHIGFDLESGYGLLASGGTVREIKWSRTADQLSFFEEDGETPLTVAVGKTFVALTDKTLRSETEIIGDTEDTE